MSNLLWLATHEGVCLCVCVCVCVCVFVCALCVGMDVCFTFKTGGHPLQIYLITGETEKDVSKTI